MTIKPLWPSDGMGPPIPADAKVLARLPLSVMRRVIPEEITDDGEDVDDIIRGDQ